jgi:hypothetical protein
MLGCVAAIAVGLFGVSGAGADTAITVGDGWHEFDWVGQTQPVIPSQSPFTFTATTAVTLMVVDVLCTGEQFTVYDNNTLLGTVDGKKNVTPSCDFPGATSDPSVAITNSAYGSASAVFDAGPHSISIVVSTAPWPNGGAYIRVDSLCQALPETYEIAPAKKFTRRNKASS